MMLLAAGGVLSVWQWSNIKAARLYVSQSQEDLAEKILQNKESKRQLLLSYGDVAVCELTSEEEEQLVRGELSAEEAVQRLQKAMPIEEIGEGNPQESMPSSGSSRPMQKEVQAEVPTEVVNKYVLRLNVLRAEFLAKLGGLYAAAKGDYLALPKAKRTKASKVSIAMGYMIDAANYEAECDKRVNQILAELSNELEAKGKDPSIADALQSAYVQEKDLKKAYYLSQLGKETAAQFN